MSTLYVDTINEKTSGNGIYIPGHVLQVIQSEGPDGQISTSSTNFVASGHTASITPSSSSSKLLVFFTGGRMSYSSSGDGLKVSLRRKIGSGSYSDLTGGFAKVEMSSTYGLPHSFSYLDSPATTSAVTYENFIASLNGNAVLYDTNGVDTNAMFTIMEIGA